MSVFTSKKHALKQLFLLVITGGGSFGTLITHSVDYYEIFPAIILLLIIYLTLKTVFLVFIS
jgi:hypothetical protein